ncbi:hypothetical protein LMG29542_05548 [Paraburkholderia humisilvae]|uniref:Uncharacterized protein n=2 Tax=Paraburkholderia humisilvae TaxID=627669 RepID=A0A6J5EKY5_9BURK|nr:hypothetical protein LMG29542_05548 [Paraburkholderia humisilvae]
MTHRKPYGGLAGMAVRLLAAFMLLFVAFAAKAESLDEFVAYCHTLFAKAGAVPGAPLCLRNAANGGIYGMGSLCVRRVDITVVLWRQRASIGTGTELSGGRPGLSGQWRGHAYQDGFCQWR